jgi:hypothetical protein
LLSRKESRFWMVRFFLKTQSQSIYAITKKYRKCELFCKQRVEYSVIIVGWPIANQDTCFNIQKSTKHAWCIFMIVPFTRYWWAVSYLYMFGFSVHILCWWSSLSWCTFWIHTCGFFQKHMSVHAEHVRCIWNENKLSYLQLFDFRLSNNEWTLTLTTDHSLIYLAAIHFLQVCFAWSMKSEKSMINNICKESCMNYDILNLKLENWDDQETRNLANLLTR